MTQDGDNLSTGFAAPLGSPDPHGEAALVLVETLIHALIAKGSLSTLEAIDIVDDAVEVQSAMDEDGRHIHGARPRAAALLRIIGGSLSSDLPMSLDSP